MRLFTQMRSGVYAVYLAPVQLDSFSGIGIVTSILF